MLIQWRQSSNRGIFQSTRHAGVTEQREEIQFLVKAPSLSLTTRMVSLARVCVSKFVSKSVAIVRSTSGRLGCVTVTPVQGLPVARFFEKGF